jgi:hypothetical protein
MSTTQIPATQTPVLDVEDRGWTASDNRGIHHAIVTALGGLPKTHMATLVPQAGDALAIEAVERGRTPVLVLDEAHLLDHAQLEGIRMLTLCRAGGYAEVGAAAPGSPWWARETPGGHSA